MNPSAAGRVLAKTLWLSRSITALDLSRAGMDDHAGAYMARALRHAESPIVKLDLDHNELGDRTCSSFAETLAFEGSKLRSLSLEGNDLGRDVVDGNRQRLSRDDDGIGQQPGFERLTASLKHNSALSRLGLWRCGINRHAGTLLAQGVEENTVLILVEVGQNDLEFEDERRIEVVHSIAR